MSTPAIRLLNFKKFSKRCPVYGAPLRSIAEVILVNDFNIRVSCAFIADNLALTNHSKIWFKMVNKILLTVVVALLAAVALPAQTGMVKKTAKAAATEQTETFLVLGNCGMCQRIIEKAAIAAGASKATWDVDNDQLTATFDPAKTSADAIQKAVALAGYDNVGYKAPDAVYNDLHGCCKYDRSGAPSVAKSCTEGDAPKN